MAATTKTSNRQLAWVYDLNKCIGCQTCSVACKVLWTRDEGEKHQWWMSVNTMPGLGTPKAWEEMGGGIDPTTGKYCAPGVNGDLWVRGTRGVQMFFEYYKNPEAMAKSITADGWFQTGDTARLGEDGYFYFADRDKDILKVGGENVSARQVEECIHGLLGMGVLDELAVVAQKHDMLDEVPVVFASKSWTAAPRTSPISSVRARCTSSRKCPALHSTKSPKTNCAKSPMHWQMNKRLRGNKNPVRKEHMKKARVQRAFSLVHVRVK